MLVFIINGDARARVECEIFLFFVQVCDIFSTHLHREIVECANCSFKNEMY